MTKDEVKEELLKLGLERGMKILVHVAMSKIGYIEGGAEAFISALKEVVSEDGVITLPAYNSYNGYKPRLSVVSEVFKKQSDTIRTNQVIASFALWGKEKEKIAANVEYTQKGLSFEAGEKSILARLYENGGWSLMLGTDYSTCTILHLAENRAEWLSKIIFTDEYILSDEKGGEKKILFKDVAYQSVDFNEIGKAFEALYKDDASAFRSGKVGNARSKLINQRIFVDFAVNWINQNRK